MAERVVNVLKYKKPAFWISVITIIVVVVSSALLISGNVITKVDHGDSPSGANEADSTAPMPLLNETADNEIIASIPEKGIYLYGVKDPVQNGSSCLLYIGNVCHSYGIPWETPRLIMPEMKLYDFDRDGKEELAIINYYGSGSGVSVMGLHVLKSMKR